MSERGQLPSPDIIRNSLSAVVQIVALRQGFLGNMQSAWTGSGTIVDPGGIILTNCHVANPRAMGMPAPPADKLAIAVTTRSDEPPALTYFADIIVQSPELDLAVLKISAGIDGRATGKLSLPFITVGDSDQLELADNLAIFGYPGIGGETVTFTSGSVAGFTGQDGVNARRAWIKTDATIAGGNSGGTAINHDGELVGIPTQAAAGTNVTPVDARPVVDTNQDGRIDHRDTPMAIGGFINGLRPVNLAKPLLKQAGVKVTGAGSRAKVPMAPVAPPPAQPAAPKPAAAPKKSSARGGTKPATKPATQPAADKASFSNLVFSGRVTRDGRPVNPSAVLPVGSTAVYVTFDFSDVAKGTPWSQVWALNGQPVLKQEGQWDEAGSGRKTLSLVNRRGLPEGEYHLVLTLHNAVAAQGKVAIGRAQDDTDTEISGQVVDARSGRGIADALVIALKPGVRVRDFVQVQSPEMAFTSARTDKKGAFVFPIQLPKGQAYGLIVVARGYKDLVVEGALRVSAQAPEQAQMSAIPLQPE